jgi:hypothetical protein
MLRIEFLKIRLLTQSVNKCTDHSTKTEMLHSVKSLEEEIKNTSRDM